jgi:hypothetical protein
MFFYSWTALTGMTNDAAVCLGICGDREKAQRDAEEPLRDRSGSVVWQRFHYRPDGPDMMTP